MSSGSGGNTDRYNDLQDQKQDHLIKKAQSERDYLTQIRARMQIYDQLFGPMEKDVINEGSGIINPARINNKTKALRALADREASIQRRLDELEKEKSDGKKALAWKKDMGGKANVRVPEKDYIVDDPKEEIKRLKSEINGIDARRKKILSGLSTEVSIQRKNSRKEQIEQAKERASGLLEAAVNQTDAADRVRRKRFGLSAEPSGRIGEEMEREKTLLMAAAEAGARNRAKTDIEQLFKAKLGAVAGGDLTDRAASEQMRQLSNSYMGAAAARYDRAAAVTGQMMDQANQYAQNQGYAAGQFASYLTDTVTAKDGNGNSIWWNSSGSDTAQNNQKAIE